MPERHLLIHTDGGARGNPGPAAIGAVIAQNGKIIKQISECIGETTNNQAEYQAVYSALTFARQHGATHVDLYADSELVVKQLRGEYKVKNKELGSWFIKVTSLAHHIGRVRYHTVRREENVEADALVNQALDRQALGE